jgi:ATP-dependent helicase/DNAse subunit B
MRHDGERMPLALVTGPANAGKARLLLEQVRAAAAAGRDPLLVVPTSEDVEHYRRELAESGVVMGVRVERFAGLIAEVARRAGAGGRPLGPLARERLAAAAARSLELRALGAAAQLPGFARALAALAGELEAVHVDPARMRRAVRGESEHLVEVGALYGAYREVLERSGAEDAELHAVRALDALRLAPRRWGATPVFLYGFDDLTALELDAIETLARVVDAPVTLSLSYEAGRIAFAGRATAFAELSPLAARHDALPARPEHYDAPALHRLERGLFEDGLEEGTAPASVVRLLEGGGERAELELVAEEVARLLAGGFAPGEIAIVARPLGDSAALLAELLTARGIPFALPRRRVAFAGTALGRGLLGLARAARPQGGAEDLLAWLRAPGVLERPGLADRLEARLRARGVRSAAGAREIWEQDGWPLEALDRLARAFEEEPAHPPALVASLQRELRRLLAAPDRGRAPLLAGERAIEARAFAAAERGLGELAALGALAGGGDEVLAALAGLEVEAGDPPAGGAVEVLEPLALRARRVRALFVTGLQEGRFPAAARAEPFLADADRARLSRERGLPLPRREHALAAERYLFYATVSRPRELLFLSWHAADDDGAPQPRSPFVEDVIAVLGALPVTRRALGAVDGAPTADGAAPATLGPLRSPEALAPIRERPAWSASALELYAGCPVRWLVERLLAASDLEPDPEPLVRGALAHDVLEATLARLREETSSARLDGERLERALELLGEELRERSREHEVSPDPERRRAAVRRLHADLERLLRREASERRRTEPRHLELAFGFTEEDADGLPALELAGGLRLRGRIDRVDVDPQAGTAVVVDYKASRAYEGAKWVSERHWQLALYMRAVQELLGLRAVGGLYQPVSARDQRPRGALLAGADPGRALVNGDAMEEDELTALVEAAVQAAREAWEQARAGVLEPRPATCTPSGRCAHPAICRCER